MGGKGCGDQVIDNVGSIRLPEEELKAVEVWVVQYEAPLSDVGYLCHVTGSSKFVIGVGEASVCQMIWGRSRGRVMLLSGRLCNYACMCIWSRICILSLIATICR